MNTTTAFEICVMHRDPLLAAGLVATLAREPGLQVHQGPDATDAVVVADYDTALEVLQAAQQPSRMGPAAGVPRVLVVTPRCTEAEIRHALRVGVRGYLPSDSTQAELVDGVRALQREVRYLAPRIAERIADSLNHAQLTTRETEVLRHMATGCPNKRIAMALDISVGTVKAHTKAIFGKLDCASRTQAVVRAEQRGLLSGSLARAISPALEHHRPAGAGARTAAGAEAAPLRALHMATGRMHSDRHHMPRLAM
jgi:DNA-binding NarL/FixJ family response regulator